MDANGNGLRDTGESVGAGLTVNLYSQYGHRLGSTTTNRNGFYQFTDVLPGESAYVQFVLPDGRLFTFADVGADDLRDSDVIDPVNGYTAQFKLVDGENVTADAGFVMPAVLTGSVFNDLDNDGIRRPWEAVLGGWTVFLDANANGVLDDGETSTITSVLGTYRFDNLLPTLFNLTYIAPPQWDSAASRAVTLTPGQTVTVDLPARTLVPNTYLFPIGAETRADSLGMSGFQYEKNASSVAINDNGNMVLVWPGASSGDIDIFMRRFDSSGTPLGSETRVNTFTAGDQSYPVVAAAADASFVVAWISPQGVDGDGFGIYARRFDPFGNALSDDFLVNTQTTGSQQDPEIAMTPEGAFVVSWVDYPHLFGGETIRAQRFDNAGSRIGDEFIVNADVPDQLYNGSVAINSSGEIAFSWWTIQSDTNRGNIFARRFSSDGNAIDDPILVTNAPAAKPVFPTIGIDNQGNFAVNWRISSTSGGSTAGAGIFLQLYDATASRRGNTLRVDSGTIGTLGTDPTIAFDRMKMDASGNMLLVWDGLSKTNRVVIARGFNAAGSPTGDEWQANTYTTGEAYAPGMSLSRNGRAVIVWEGNGPGTSTGTGGIRTAEYFQRVDLFSDPAWVGDRVWKDTNGDGVQNAGEPGLANISVTLFNRDNTRVLTTTTDASGNYFIPVEGDQPSYLQFSNAFFLLFTFRSAGSDDNADSDVGSSGLTPVLSLPAGSTRRDVDAGLVARATVSGTVFQDNNGNGIFDTGEPTLSGWTVFADDNQNGSMDAREAFEISDVNGAYGGFAMLPGLHPIAIQGQSLWETPTATPFEFLPAQARTLNIGVRSVLDGAAPLVKGASFLVSGGSARAAAACAMAPDESSLIVWSAPLPGSSTNQLFARRYDGAGLPLGAEFRIVGSASGAQDLADVTMLANGDFAIVWQNTRTSDGLHLIYARIYDSAGTPRGNDFLIGAGGITPSISAEPDGGFVVVWVGSQGGQGGVLMRHYDAAGVPLGTAIFANTAGSLQFGLPDVAVNTSGQCVVVWQRQNGNSRDVFGRLFNADAAANGPEFLINVTTGAEQDAPVVGMDDAGRFVVAWRSFISAHQGIYARRFDETGVPQSGEITIDQSFSTAGLPALAMEPNGAFLVAWTPPSGAKSVLLQRFDAAGARLGSVQTAYQNSSFPPADPAVALRADGEFVVAWSAGGTSATQSGVMARRYAIPPDIAAASFDDASAAHSISLRFTEDVGPSIDAADFIITNLSLGGILDPAAFSMVYEKSTRTATLTFSGYPDGILPDGNYRATLSAASISDPAGNALARDWSLDFFVLTGDANHDRQVGFADLVAVAQHYEKAQGATFAQGDLNRDGAVDFADLVIVAQKYGTILPLPPTNAPVSAAASPLLNRRAQPKPIFSDRPIATRNAPKITSLPKQRNNTGRLNRR